MNLTDRWITQSDQLTKEQSRRTAFRNTVAYVTGKWWRSVLLLAIVLGVFFAVDMIILGPRSETVTMTLNYEQASDGLTPNATRFNMYEIKTEPVLQALARYSGLAGRVSTDDLAECIQVENTQETGVAGTGNDFISTSYHIDFRQTGKIPHRTAKTMLTLLCKAYREYFYENYVVGKTAVGQGLDELDTSTEFLSRVDAFQLKIQQIERYATERMGESGNFRDPVSGLSFLDIQLRAQNLKTYDLVNLRSYVIFNAISEDAGILRDQLLYRERMEKLVYDKRMASYGVNNEGIERFDKVMTSVLMVPTINDKSLISVYTAQTGMDSLVEKADEDLNEAMRRFIQMESDQTIADSVVSKAVNQEQWDKTEQMTADLDKKIDDLFFDLEVTDKAYESTRVQRYMMFTDFRSALSLRSALIHSVVMTAGFAVIMFVVIYLQNVKKKETAIAL